MKKNFGWKVGLLGEPGLPNLKCKKRKRGKCGNKKGLLGGPGPPPYPHGVLEAAEGRVGGSTKMIVT